MGTLKNTENKETKSPAIRPSSPANLDCKDPNYILATIDGTKKQYTTDGFHGHKGLVTYTDNLFLDKTDKELCCKLWSHNRARTNQFIDVFSFITGRNIPIVLSNHSKVILVTPSEEPYIYYQKYIYHKDEQQYSFGNSLSNGRHVVSYNCNNNNSTSCICRQQK